MFLATIIFKVFYFLDTGSPARKRKRRNGSTIPMPKNAVCLLNELRPGLLYETISQTGPVHCPIFTISVKVRL